MVFFGEEWNGFDLLMMVGVVCVEGVGMGGMGSWDGGVEEWMMVKGKLPNHPIQYSYSAEISHLKRHCGRHGDGWLMIVGGGMGKKDGWGSCW